MKELLKNALLVLVSIITGLGLLELVLPLLDDESLESAVYQVKRPVVQYMYGQYHPVLQFTLKDHLQNERIHYPGALDYKISTNSKGFRGPEWDLADDRKNIILVGDSFGFGWGVQWRETLGQILEKRLQRQDPSWQIINLAIPGYEIQESVLALELYQPQLRPQAVIYVFCHNDLGRMQDAQVDGSFVLDHNTPWMSKEAWDEIQVRNQPGYWNWDKFRRGSYLHAFHQRYLQPITSMKARQSLILDPVPQGFDFPPPMDEAPIPQSGAKKDFLELGLSRLKQASGGPLFLIATSDKTILERRDAADNLRWILYRFAQDHEGVFFADFESAVRRTPDGRKFYLYYDDHWSAAGHQLAADLLWKDVEKELSP